MDNFLSHPSVEYIPLSIINPREGEWQNPFDSKPFFFIYQDRDSLAAKLVSYGLPQINPSAEEMNDYLVVVSLDFIIKRGYFRFLTVKLVGEARENSYQIFYLTKKYFPRRVLHFAFYTEEGEKISWENVEIKSSL